MELKKLEELSDSLESILSDLTAALGTSQAAEIRELLNCRRWGTANGIRMFLDILDNPTTSKTPEQIISESPSEPAAISVPKGFSLPSIFKKP